jgi:hypothetical protein
VPCVGLMKLSAYWEGGAALGCHEGCQACPMRPRKGPSRETQKITCRSQRLHSRRRRMRGSARTGAVHGAKQCPRPMIQERSACILWQKAEAWLFQTGGSQFLLHTHRCVAGDVKRGQSPGWLDTRRAVSAKCAGGRGAQRAPRRGVGAGGFGRQRAGTRVPRCARLKPNTGSWEHLALSWPGLKTARNCWWPRPPARPQHRQSKPRGSGAFVFSGQMVRERAVCAGRCGTRTGWRC